MRGYQVYPVCGRCGHNNGEVPNFETLEDFEAYRGPWPYYGKCFACGEEGCCPKGPGPLKKKSTA